MTTKKLPTFDDHNNDIFMLLAHIKTQSQLNTSLALITYLKQLARLMEAETSADLGPEMIKIYAWEIESVAKKLAKLVKRISTEK